MSANLIREFSESSQLGSNADYVEQLYEAWLNDPSSVSDDWRTYFDSLPGKGVHDVPHSLIVSRIEAAQRQRDRRGEIAGAPVSDEHARKQAGVLRLLTAYRSRGHLDADLDPLALAAKRNPPDLGLAFHSLSDADLDTEFDTGTYCGGDAGRMKLRDLWQHLKDTYTATIGAEFMHISDHEQRRWVYSRLEKASGNAGLSRDEQLRVLERLTAADGLERYLHTKYVGQKRFSLEGGESFIASMDALVQHAAAKAVQEVVIGMAHRGRLNVLVNTLGKSPAELFSEFEHTAPENLPSGDVKYHQGFSSDVTTASGPIHLSLAFNPSHLEIVNPVVEGSVRARQRRRDDKTGDQ
ncbi:MAG TPA: 2-oxoglutarate dehydrogenase E1 component, partial [Rhodanobacteraceae bacterium]|nr:2-oxoglutarate dehydrogenase E1 component [Rhodanobacteraceae bacterium]